MMDTFTSDVVKRGRMGRIKKVPKTKQISKIFDNKCERKPDNGSVLHYNNEPREGTRIKVNENTNRIMRMLRHGR